VAASLSLAIIVAASSTSARAEVRVQGDVAAVRVDASQASVSEVLSALGPAFNVRYRTSISLDGVIHGTYTGSLGRVISRMLDGYSYIVKNDEDTIEVVVFGRKGERAVAIEPPRAPPGRHTATQWRTSTEKTAPPRRP
jgi:hypothetical protein